VSSWRGWLVSQIDRWLSFLPFNGSSQQQPNVHTNVHGQRHTNNFFCKFSIFCLSILSHRESIDAHAIGLLARQAGKWQAAGEKEKGKEEGNPTNQRVGWVGLG